MVMILQREIQRLIYSLYTPCSITTSLTSASRARIKLRCLLSSTHQAGLKVLIISIVHLFVCVCVCVETVFIFLINIMIMKSLGIGYHVLVDVLRYVSPSHVVKINIYDYNKNLPAGLFWLDGYHDEIPHLMEIQSAYRVSYKRS